ncbi:hypothetical protein SERLA73DRAFT_174599 [Serpula lacrymans var. lacrymans S7.3]|uniref:Uncharacterized protein n=1 Tax=Serpula lacrymans var. lacrymans (strain S7.3) TaxID=936435 RepID=F8PIZ6_SERL3|nr:hypothetical protein SERLA73DRAFT_174599 [Serpula lacrymans var. lacrymans S7.3]
MSLQATNRAFTVFGFMGFLAGIILLPMHCRARNISICLYIVWTSFLCLIFCVNSIVWNNNVVNWAPVWCDFSSRLITASAVGSQVGLLCIVRHLYRIITMKSTNDSSHEIRRELIVVLCAGISIPLVLSVFQYITEHSRFSILENIGCFPTVPPTQITIPLYLIWPFVFGIVSFLYAGFICTPLFSGRSTTGNSSNITRICILVTTGAF